MIVGHGADGTPVVDGVTAFRWRDAHGLPLDAIVAALRTHGLAFDVWGYAHAALASGNFTPERLRRDFADAGAPPPVLRWLDG